MLKNNTVDIFFIEFFKLIGFFINQIKKDSLNSSYKLRYKRIFYDYYFDIKPLFQREMKNMIDSPDHRPLVYVLAIINRS